MRVGKRYFYNHDRFPPSLPPSAQLSEHLPFDQFKVARKREEQQLVAQLDYHLYFNIPRTKKCSKAMCQKNNEGSRWLEQKNNELKVAGRTICSRAAEEQSIHDGGKKKELEKSVEESVQLEGKNGNIFWPFPSIFVNGVTNDLWVVVCIKIFDFNNQIFKPDFLIR